MSGVLETTLGVLIATGVIALVAILLVMAWSAYKGWLGL